MKTSIIVLTILISLSSIPNIHSQTGLRVGAPAPVSQPVPAPVSQPESVIRAEKNTIPDNATASQPEPATDPFVAPAPVIAPASDTFRNTVSNSGL